MVVSDSLFCFLLVVFLIAQPASTLLHLYGSGCQRRGGFCSSSFSSSHNKIMHLQAERSGIGGSSNGNGNGRNGGATPSKRQQTAAKLASGAKAAKTKILSPQDVAADNGVRLNKCLIGLSRRAADDAIAAGRVSLNGQVLNSPDDPGGTSSNAGRRVQKGDKVRLDGALQNWDTWNQAKEARPSKKVRMKWCWLVVASQLSGWLR